MSYISIAGTLILNGDILTSGEVRVENTGLLMPVSRDLIDGIYSCPAKDLMFQNGKTPSITSTASDIQILGTVNGIGQGFPPNVGPGANSTLKDSQDDPSDIYGANHAGIGYVTSIPGTIELVEEEFIIHTINVVQGGVDLRYLPLYNNVAVNVVHGTSQSPGIDFVLMGDFVSWQGLALENLISVGDIIRVIYLADTSRYFPGPKESYGSYEAPTSIGSGSGETSGGSGLKLVARSGTINITGTVNISGENGSSSRSGGGSGGSFWAQAYDLDGGGTIISEGGDASYAYAGGGGGGYVTLNYEHGNDFQGPISVAGHKGGTHGIVTVSKINPFFYEKFTGSYLNPKWWEIVEEPIVVNNSIQMDTTTSDFRTPRLESLFTISGNNIQVDCDFNPAGIESSYYTAYFQLFVDDRNWVSVAKKFKNVFGMYSVDGFLSQTAIPYDYTNTVFRISKTDSTYTFQIVDATAGPTTILTESIPELENSTFRVAFGTQKDEVDASNFVSDYYKLTNIDYANGYVTLSGIPIDTSNVALNVLGGGPQVYGVDYTVSDQRLFWMSSSLNLEEDDEIVVEYSNDTTFNDLSISWDNFKVFYGILRNVESPDPILYVDSVYGSDSSDGRALTPLRNLFVATSWAKRSSTIVLYDGTYNPTEVYNKNLTIQGAYGARPLIITSNAYDTTDSNWENSCLTLHKCGGLVKNVYFSRAREAIYADYASELEILNCHFSDVTTAIKFDSYSKNCRVLSNTIHDTSTGIIFNSQAYSPYIYSNVVHDSSVGVQLSDASNFIVSSNTFDLLNTCVFTDNSSVGFVASNNLTHSSTGALLNGDSSAGFFNNNFYGTTNTTIGTGSVTDFSNNIITQPAYVNQTLRNYHLLSFSADRSTGTDLFDTYCVDKDGARRLSSPGYDIGAYQYINAPHISGSYYVDSSGDDFWNTGNAYSPFRTLDKAMSVADSSVYVSSIFNRDSSGDAVAVGGRYDSYYLNLKEQNILFVDASKQIQSVSFESNFSNINLGTTLFVSPSGSDGTIMGGDGTDTGGTGTLHLPFRTIARALEVSSPGTFIVVLAGDYPIFNGKANRVIAGYTDRTGVPDGRMYIEDLFSTPAAMYPGHNESEELLWHLDYTSFSDAFIQEGYLSMSYDGTYSVSADSNFGIDTGDTTYFEITTEVRQAFDPIFFSINNGLNTVTFKYVDGDYTCTVITNGESYNCWGNLHNDSSMTNQFFTDYICVSSEDVQNKYINLSYIVGDTTNVALNVIGGSPQELGVDFYVQDSKISWNSLGLDGEVKAGDILRVIYIAQGLSDPAKIKFVLDGNTMTIYESDQGHYARLMKRTLHSNPNGIWNASFYMNEVDHTGSNVIGRGYASKFLAISDSFTNTVKAKPYQHKTWRQPIILHK